MIKEELKKLDISDKSLRKFGITIGIVFGIIAAYLFYTGSHYLYFIGGLALLLILFGVMAPAALRTVYIYWMALAILLGFIMTRVILTLLYYLVMTPTGLYLRATKKDLLKLKTTGSEATYWEKRTVTEKSQADYEKQF